MQCAVFPTVAITTPYADCTYGALRLVGGANVRDGRVEICINNAWGTVCNNLFDDEDARVVCTEMGFSEEGTFVVMLLYILTTIGLCGTYSKLVVCKSLYNENILSQRICTSNYLLWICRYTDP